MSVGIALTEPGKTADDVLRDADVAMYEAKAKGGGGMMEDLSGAREVMKKLNWLGVRLASTTSAPAIPPWPTSSSSRCTR